MGTFIIGVCGGSSSGKSYTSRLLKDKFTSLVLNVKIIHTDDYYKKNKPTIRSKLNGKIYTDYDNPASFNLSQIVNEAKESMKDNFDIIIIEGLMVLYADEIRNLLDYKIYINCPEHIRIERIKNSNYCGKTPAQMLEQYENGIKISHMQFIESVKDFSDIILDGSKDNSLNIDIICMGIKELL